MSLLPAYLHGLSDKSVYIVTTNDYLARRDGLTMGQVYRALGVSVGIISSSSSTRERQDAYGCGVTYLSNQEIGFDFLRDNLAMTTNEVVQSRPYNFCLVDEADSVLIDEARTPLIISRQGPPPTDKYISAAQICRNLKRDEHYSVLVKEQRIELTTHGVKFCEQIVGKTLYDLADPCETMYCTTSLCIALPRYLYFYLVMYCTTSLCIALPRYVLHYLVMYCTTSLCIALPRYILHYLVMYCTTSLCFALPRYVLHYLVVYRTTSLCIALPRCVPHYFVITAISLCVPLPRN